MERTTGQSQTIERVNFQIQKRIAVNPYSWSVHRLKYWRRALSTKTREDGLAFIQANIKSCTNYLQVESVKRLVEFYRCKYDLTEDDIRLIYSNLNERCSELSVD